MRKFSWVFLLCAIVMVIQTPFVLAGAFAAMRADHRLVSGMAIAFLFRLGWIGAFLFMWWKFRSNQVMQRTDAIPKAASAELFTVQRAYFLSKENSWWRFKLLAYDDVGRLAVSESQIVFQSASRTIVIDKVQQLTYGKQGRDFINDWVKVEYLDGSTPRIAFFADGGSLGWSGVQGGTAKIFQAMQQLPAVA